MESHPRLVVVTVNFDEQVEDQCPLDIKVYAKTAEFDAAAQHVQQVLGGDRSEGVPVLKIHGTIGDPDSLVADLAQTVNGLSSTVRDAMDETLAAGPTDWVWIGCSMRDRDVNQWMRTKRDSDLQDWWVDPLPGPAIADFVRDGRPVATQVEFKRRLVTESADAFFEALAARVETVAGA
jgi:hypothetical protein